MAINLLNLEPQKISKNLKGKFITLYGSEKVGKTTIASKFKNVLIAAFEMGTNALDNVYVQPIKTWSDWKQMIRQLTREKTLQDKFDTIALDVVDIAYDLCSKYICNENGVEKINEIPYGQGYALVDKEFETSLRDLQFAGYGLLFISHETDRTLIDDKGEEYTKIVPSMSKRCGKIVNGMVDIIGYLRNVTTRNEDGTTTNKRYIYLQGDDRFLAGSRFQPIPTRIEMSYENLIEAIYDAIDKTAAGNNSAPTEENNPFTTRTYDDLMDEAQSIWIKLANEKKTDLALSILEDVFGKPTKFSDIKEEELDKFQEVLFRIDDEIK